MYTILMEADGSLVRTTPVGKIRQGDNLTDSFRFIVPKIYKNIDLTDFVGVVKYVNPANIAKINYLTVNNPEYKTDYIEYRLPITGDMTQFAGDISLYVTFTKNDEENKKIYTTHSGKITISIEPVDDYFSTDESLQAIDKKIAELQSVAEAYDKSKADNIEIDGSELYLTANGEKIGNTVDIGEVVDENFEIVSF